MSVLHVHGWGPADGAPLLVVHGVTNHGGRMARLAERLPGMRVLAPDLRGHGRSTWDPPWDAARHVADLLETLHHHLGAGAVDVTGHSFGGLLGMRLAAAAPARVRRLALIDPAIALAPARARREADAVLADPGWPDPAAARAARRALRPPHARDTVDEDLADFLVRDGDGRYRLRFSRAAAVCAWSEMAASLTRPLPGPPTLLVPALGADFVGDELRAALREAHGARLREHPIDAGHMLIWDAVDELAAALRRFLSAPAPARPGVERPLTG